MINLDAQERDYGIDKSEPPLAKEEDKLAQEKVNYFFQDFIRGPVKEYINSPSIPTPLKKQILSKHILLAFLYLSQDLKAAHAGNMILEKIDFDAIITQGITETTPSGPKYSRVKFENETKKPASSREITQQRNEFAASIMNIFSKIVVDAGTRDLVSFDFINERDFFPYEITLFEDNSIIPPSLGTAIAFAVDASQTDPNVMETLFKELGKAHRRLCRIAV